MLDNHSWLLIYVKTKGVFTLELKCAWNAHLIWIRAFTLYAHWFQCAFQCASAKPPKESSLKPQKSHQQLREKVGMKQPDHNFVQVGQQLQVAMSVCSFLIPKKWGHPDLKKVVSFSMPEVDRKEIATPS